MRNKYVWLFLLLSLLNLLVMHYTIISTCDAENELHPEDFVDNLAFVTIEVILLFSGLMVLCWGRVRRALLLTWVVTALWAFCNLVYSRFFFQYIPLSAFTESDGLLDPIVIRSLVNGFRWGDLYFLASLVLAVCLYRRTPPIRLTVGALRYTLLGILTVILVGIGAHWVCRPILSPSAYFGMLDYELFRTWRYTCRPLYSNFQRGNLRSLAYAAYCEIVGSQSLTAEQEQTLNRQIRELKPLQQSAHQLPDSIQNVIVILVESYMSFTVDLKVGGEEVTPFLNSLARDSSIYYNGHMRPNITCGESSDGQFIYMTGMLPLRSEITITKTKRNVLPALPKVLKEARGLRSRMVIPTSAAMWSQDAMCKAYGVERLYSVNEYHGPHEPCLSDDQVVALADSVDGLSREPFFSMVLTFSTHMPYDKTVDPTFKATSQVQPEDYANYLNACHFMDRNLQRYVESLKRHGLYDNSLILIVSDHHVQEHFLTLPGVKQRELPVFIIHGGIDRQNAWTGPCHQLDVFTTLLDLLGIRPAWTGLGHTLINPHYENSLPEGSPKWDYSDWMIQSDWFKR